MLGSSQRMTISLTISWYLAYSSFSQTSRTFCWASLLEPARGYSKSTAASRRLWRTQMNTQANKSESPNYQLFRKEFPDVDWCVYSMSDDCPRWRFIDIRHRTLCDHLVLGTDDDSWSCNDNYDGDDGDFGEKHANEFWIFFSPILGTISCQVILGITNTKKFTHLFWAMP